MYLNYLHLKWKWNAQLFLRYESNSELPILHFWETMRCSIYDSKNAQLLDFHIVTPQLPPQKVPEVFLVWLPI